MIELRPARPDEADVLSDVALKSKAHWGYSQDFLDACRSELTFQPADIAARRFVVATVSDSIVGFYSVDGEPPEGELGNLWVLPSSIGTGLGRRLWEHAMATARTAGFTELRIDADPYAEGFYLAMGAVRIGGSPSASIPGRTLPLLLVHL